MLAVTSMVLTSESSRQHHKLLHYYPYREVKGDGVGIGHINYIGWNGDGCGYPMRGLTESEGNGYCNYCWTDEIGNDYWQWRMVRGYER